MSDMEKGTIITRLNLIALQANLLRPSCIELRTENEMLNNADDKAVIPVTRVRAIKYNPASCDP
jgi:hypothetical protein